MSWPLVKLGDICTTTQGVQITKANTSDELYERGCRYLYIADFISDKKLSFVDDIYDHKKVTENDLVMANTGSPGRVFKGKPGILSNNLFKISFDLMIVDRNYLYLMLSSNIFQNVLQGQMKGGIQKHLGHQTISRQEIPLPPLAEQKRIAAILDKADAIRRKRQQAIKLADDFLRSVFLDMFGDPVMNTHKLPTKPWSKVLKIINGRNQKKVQEVSGEYPIMGSGGEMGRANDYQCPENTVIIGRKGNINKPILVKEKFWNIDTAFGLSVDEEQLSYNYLFWFCKFFNFERLNKTVTIPSLTKSDLLILKIPLPSIDEQKVFDMLVEKIDVLLEQFKASELKVSNSFNSLSQKAFAGEL